jgi:hypothetical protein
MNARAFAAGKEMTLILTNNQSTNVVISATVTP